jgi:hypothetical protein
VQETNISAWRRSTFGDMTLVFRFNDHKAASPVLLATAGPLTYVQCVSSVLPKPVAAGRFAEPAQAGVGRPQAPPTDHRLLVGTTRACRPHERPTCACRPHAAPTRVCRLFERSTCVCRLPRLSTCACRPLRQSTCACRLLGGSACACRRVERSICVCRPYAASVRGCRLLGRTTRACRPVGLSTRACRPHEPYRAEPEPRWTAASELSTGSVLFDRASFMID